ncbi:DUF4132 domain-containing protein [Buchananella hordeovulneris]|uniref:DUF4132 domain-containing protein n=1 Tax=Buchananella hordeovulneris TaxID=52770 RepID=UPI000F5E8718|nr:DUF4132 domain-containing protein [Buchananella hordeovulneris]RRD43268.1 DUF4132 domain-containing protein [Buchananella hordeovulneris]
MSSGRHDLGLRITPFEKLYNLDAVVELERDDTPFVREAEESRAQQLATLFQHDYFADYWGFREPPFVRVPGPQRRAWWAQHLRTHNSHPTDVRRSGPAIHVPQWLAAVLRTNWEGSLADILADLGQYGPDVLLARGVLHWFAAAEVAAARTAAADAVAHLQEPNELDFPEFRTALFTFAALHPRAHAELRRLYALIPDDLPAGAHPPTPRSPVVWLTVADALALPTPAERREFARRTNAKAPGLRMLLPWLISTGTAGLPAADRYQLPEGFMHERAQAITGPAQVSYMLRQLGHDTGRQAWQWLAEHLDAVLAADLSTAEVEEVVPLLRLASPAWRAAAPRTGACGPALAQVETEESLPLADPPAWWQAAAQRLPKAQELPFPLAALPPLRVDGRRLAAPEVAQLVQALRAQTRHPLVTAVREHVDAVELDDFATTLLLLWLAPNPPAKQAWLMTGAGWLGGDKFVAALAPRIRWWPSAQRFQRAVTALTALHHVGSARALSELADITKNMKTASVKRRAAEILTELAAARGLSPDELEDQLVPDGGLDATGRRRFDYGARQFVSYLTDTYKVVARQLAADGQPQGKELTGLPDPLASDDADRAWEAKSEFAAVKKLLTGTVRTQKQRFARFMVEGRRWRGEDFAAHIATHVVLRHVLRGLVWGVWDGEELTATARLDADGQLVDAADEAVAVAGREVSVVHPLQLSRADRQTWAGVLADYELAPLFKQLSHPTATLPAGQDPQLPTATVEPRKLVAAAKKFGWEAAPPADGGYYHLHAWSSRLLGLTVVLVHSPGLAAWSVKESEPQTLSALFVVPGTPPLRQLPHTPPADAVAWSQVPAFLVSEVLTTLAAL